MTNLVRQEIMTAADTVVVKVGSRVLTREDGSLDDERVAAIADQLARLRLDGRKAVLVSSGAVAAGIGRLGWKRRPTDLAELQAAAAVGQSRLIESYNKALAPHGLNAAQVLLTAEDLQHRTRYLNVRNTLLRSFAAARGYSIELAAADTRVAGKLVHCDNPRLSTILAATFINHESYLFFARYVVRNRSMALIFSDNKGDSEVTRSKSRSSVLERLPSSTT